MFDTITLKCNKYRNAVKSSYNVKFAGADPSGEAKVSGSESEYIQFIDIKCKLCINTFR